MSEQRPCEKITFNHWHEAIKYANNMRLRLKDNRSKALRPYNCKVCGKVHLTSQGYNPKRWKDLK